jgi:hypothetical protein
MRRLVFVELGPISFGVYIADLPRRVAAHET